MGKILDTITGAIDIYLNYAYWAVKLDNGKLLRGTDERFDLTHATKRPLDWHDDLVSTGDVMRVRELWLLCPPNWASPLGNTAMLPIIEPGTAFMFKVSSVESNIAASWRSAESIVIGRVTDKETGACECFIWDYPLRAMGTYKTNVYTFGSWREGIAPRGALSHAALGLKL